MTENREMYHQDYYYNSSASSPFSIADPYQQLMATPADQYYTPTMATTTTAYPEYYHGSSSMMTSADYATLARAVAGDHNQPASYYAFDADASAGGKRSPADMDALLMDSSALTAGAGGGGDGSTTGGSRTPVTPNSSVSSSSNEAAGQDEEHSSCRRGSKTAADNEGQDHLVEEGKAGESKSLSKKQAGGKAATGGAAGRKKGEKRPRQPRFAFMTKSEVDHLEDGYRWRKYGQKAVKNSPYPRSYYRCTTHKCTVKKRVERSHQDPSVVITTYEGQHTHPSPAALRGAAAGAALTHSHMLAAAAAASQVQSPMPGFRRDLLMLHHQQQMQQQQQQRDLVMPQAQDDATSNPMHLLQHRQYHEAPSSDHRYHQQEVAGHQGGTTEGLLQDMVLPSSSFFNENMLQQSYNWNS